MTEIEEDYWKDIFVHLQHKNMMRIGDEKLTLQNCQKEFDRFSLIHPEIEVLINKEEDFKTFEFFISQKLKFRLYIKELVKASLLEQNGQEFIKVADAKFVNNPFPEILEFLKNKDSYFVEIERNNHRQNKFFRKQNLAGEFIKAYLNQKYRESGLVWNLEKGSEDFILKVQSDKKNGDMKIYHITIENYKKEIDSI
ncbi:MAG: hypothetical protein K5866_01520 [Treponema sp.]|nr:hypothetical protein [Treponema sp.]